MPGLDEIRWLYVPTTRTCGSVYMPRNDTCKEVDRLPLTLKECEDLCGEYVAVVVIYWHVPMPVTRRACSGLQ